MNQARDHLSMTVVIIPGVLVRIGWRYIGQLTEFHRHDVAPVFAA